MKNAFWFLDNVKIAELLLKYGANVDVLDYDGQTAFALANSKGRNWFWYRKWQNIIIMEDFFVNPLGHKEISDLLIKNGAKEWFNLFFKKHYRIIRDFSFSKWSSNKKNCNKEECEQFVFSKLVTFQMISHKWLLF